MSPEVCQDQCLLTIEFHDEIHSLATEDYIHPHNSYDTKLFRSFTINQLHSASIISAPISVTVTITDASLVAILALPAILYMYRLFQTDCTLSPTQSRNLVSPSVTL